MISNRAQHIMRSDLTQFFSSFFRESDKPQNRSYDLSIGNVCQIKVVKEVIQQALSEIMKLKSEKLTKYPGTQGYYPLNQKISALIKKETNHDVDPEEIILTNGALDGLYQLFYTCCNPGDYVFYCLPSFPYWSPADKAGVKSSMVVYKNPFDYTRTYGDIFQQKSRLNKGIKLALLNEPHNPIGQNLDENQVSVIRDTCEDQNIQIVLDEVYRSFRNDKKWIGNKFDLSKVMMVDSFSKRFGVPGLRLGFITAPKKYVQYVRAAMANQVVGVNMFAALVADEIAEIALNSNLLRQISHEISKRQKNLDKHIKKLSSIGINSTTPDGGIYRLLSLNGFLDNTRLDEIDVFEKLKNNHVKTVPGNKLFVNGINLEKSPKVLRLSVGGESRTSEAGQRIVETVEEVYAKC